MYSHGVGTNSDCSHEMYAKLYVLINFTSVGTISNIWVVNMEAFWDPPSNSTGTIRSYVVRVQYDKNKGRFANLRRCRINDLAVRQWKLDSIPSQRPLYFQVQSVEHMNMC